MNAQERLILLVTDGTDNAAAAEQTAINLARRDGASVLIVDTIRPPSVVTSWLSDEHNDQLDRQVLEKQRLLEQVAERFESAGIPARVELLLGVTSKAVAKKAASVGADLIVRYRKGGHSTRESSQFGTTAIQLVRECPGRLLLVGQQPIDHPKVLACVDAEDTVPVNQAILEAAQAIAGTAPNLQAVYCWWADESQFQHQLEAEKLHPIKSSGPTASALYREKIQRHNQEVYQRFVAQHDLSAFPGGLHLESGHPEIAIPEICRQDGVDVVVMSSASTRNLSHWALGGTVESVMEKLPCALMVVKPDDFKAPSSSESVDKSSEVAGDQTIQQITAPRALVAVFENLPTATTAAESLSEAGIPLDRIEVVVDAWKVSGTDIDATAVSETTSDAIVASATKWGGVGAAAGALTAVLTPFPGVVLGAVIVGGITGAFMGGMAGVDHAVADDAVDVPTLKEYEQLVKNGHCLLVVHGTHLDIRNATGMLKQSHGTSSHLVTVHGHAFHEHPARRNPTPK